MSFDSRFNSIEEVPIFKFAMAPFDHPDLDLIKQAYQQRGAGLGVDHNRKFSPPLQRVLNILLGCLHEDENSTIYVTFKEGQWHLITALKTIGGIEHEVLCRHEDFNQFLELVNEYSDYVEGQEHD